MARERLERSFAGRCLRSFVELNGLDRALMIASQSFTALIPLLIVFSAVIPLRTGLSVADSLVEKFNLTGETAQVVQTVFAGSGSASIGIGSLLLLTYSGVSLTRRLQQMYQDAFALPGVRGLRGSATATLGLIVLLLEITVLYTMRTVVESLPLTWTFGTPLTALSGLVLWTSVPYLLLDRRLPWRRLVPAGVLAGTAVSLYGILTTFYMPRLMTTYNERYGLFGVTVALVGWLLCVAFVVVAATVVAAELDKAPETWARRWRGGLPARPASGTGAEVDV